MNIEIESLNAFKILLVVFFNWNTVHLYMTSKTSMLTFGETKEQERQKIRKCNQTRQILSCATSLLQSEKKTKNKT